jgi:hypothetical protein
MEAMERAPTVVAESVLLEGPGFLVIHQEADGSPGPVAGVSDPLPAGLSTNVVVELDPAMVTPRLWPMLHVDDNAVGTYEFGTVQGADAPVRVNDQVVTFPINAAPSLTMSDQTLEDGTLTIEQALIDAPGWIAIHSSVDGSPGPVLATYPLIPGANPNAVIAVDPAAAGNQVFPMLHYDTGEAGVYEFGTVEGADGPVRVAGNVVVGPLNLGGGACTVTPVAAGGANLRSGPGTDFDIAGSLASGASATVTGQATGTDGLPWWQLAGGNWVRSDVVTTSGNCDNVPAVEAPATTPEASS